MAGRKPNITHDRLKEGMPKKELEDIEKSTPVYATQEFLMPKSLNKREQEVWHWLVKVFRETTNCMVSDADVQLMELYCRAKVGADVADEEWKKNPRPHISVLNDDGKYSLKANPYIKLRHDNMLMCLKYFDQLGLSPLARARVGIRGANAKKEESLFKKFMERNDD